MKRKSAKECNCCGAYAGKFQQWWNRDNGFGTCLPCVEWHEERGYSAEEIKSLFGIAGIHYQAKPLVNVD